jgi:hypothetical protein
MRFCVMVLATAESEAGAPPDLAMLEAMMAFNEQLVAAGVMAAADGLKPTSAGARVRFDGNTRSVRPGPFPLTDSTLAGFWIWNVDSLEAAIEWVKKAPNPMDGPSEIEIRPIYEVEDFSEAGADLVAKEKQMRDKLAGRAN